MKCLILAGGRGERLWPLSRKNYPKQFIQIQKGRSVFQETAARNMPYCDEFIIAAGCEYRYIIESQMAAFQGTACRCVYEEAPCGTAAAVMLACMELQPSELVFVAASDHIIDTDAVPGRAGPGYRDAVLAARQHARQGAVAVFGIHAQEVERRFGWMLLQGSRVIRFIEKPDEQQAEMIGQNGGYLQNAGMMLFENGIFQRELKKAAPAFYERCRAAFKQRRAADSGTFYSREALREIPPAGVEKLLLERTQQLRAVPCGFGFLDVGKLEDLAAAELQEGRAGMEAEPFIKLRPAFKDYLWGGTKIRDVFGRECGCGVIAESWELSAHPDGQSIIAGGRHRGMPFGRYLHEAGKEALGWKCRPLAAFPLLIKFIDAKESLSVQVHPDDDYALENEHQYGKNEMWYILDCEPGAGIYIGFSRGVDRREVERRVKDDTILEILNRVPTHPGDVFFIPAGTVHAAGAGNLICEIQQSSSCTYRLYDYNRRDKYGSPRELHLKKALDVLCYEKYQADKAACGGPAGEECPPGGWQKQKRLLCRCKYFEAALIEVSEKYCLKTDDSRFMAFVCIKGGGSIAFGSYKADICCGDCFFIPAQDNEGILAGSMKIIIAYV